MKTTMTVEELLALSEEDPDLDEYLEQNMPTKVIIERDGTVSYIMTMPDATDIRVTSTETLEEVGLFAHELVADGILFERRDQ